MHNISVPPLFCFNLTLLECKCYCQRKNMCCEWVLILPYWNVNAIYISWTFFYCCVLILPYWNVNYSNTVVPFSPPWVLILPYWNVNFSMNNSLIAFFFVLILPYWNVNKSEAWFGLVVTTMSFNLTLLECK